MPDLPDLEALVRATRPVPDPAWAARLDGRAAAGFARAPWYGRLRFDYVPALAVASALTVLVVVAVALSGGSDNASNGSRAGGAAPMSDGAGSGSAKSAAPAPRSSAGAEAVTGAPSSRAVRQDAQLTLVTPVDNVAAVSDQALRVADALGGYVASSSVNQSGGSGLAQLELKIPAAQLDQALARLSRLGHVQARSQAAEDLTDQRSALRASVTDARAERDGLRRRLARAGTEKERAALRARLQRAEHLIVVRQRRVAALQHEVAYATVDVTVNGTHRHAAAATGGGWSPGGGLHTALRVLEVSFGVLLVALAACVPLGLLGGAAALAGRLVVRRRRERALSMA
jgi:Domain of unknown function (DUF4349)